MATNLSVKFLRGLQESMPATGTDGYFYLTTDSHRLYTCIDGEVVPVNEGVTTVENLDALTAVTGAHAGDFFYVTEENILAVFNGKTFVQINPDTGVASVKLVGDGNAITDASYDPATRELTLTKGETFATKAYVGDIPNGEDGSPMAESVIAYINKKTDGIATSGNLEALGNRVSDAENRIDALQEASGNHVEKEDGKSLIADSEIVRLAEVSDGANKTEKSDINGNIKVDGAEVVVYIHPEKHSIADVDGLEERIAAIEDNFGDGEGTVESKIESAVSAETTAREEAVKGVQDEVDAVEGRMDAAEGKITALEGASATHAVKTEVEAALALKADKSVVDAMYTNEQIDTAVQGAKDYAKGLVDDLPEQTDYTVTITENTDDTTVAKTYVFTQNGAEIGAIKLAKELVVTSGSVKEVEIADDPYVGAKVGDKYIELVVANQDAPIYVPAKDLVDIYTAKDGAAEVQVAISNTNEISATLVNGGITEAKLHGDVTAKLNKTWEEVGVAQGLVDALADGQVKTNKEAIEAINNAENGILAQAKADAQTKADAAKDAAIADAAGKYETKGTAQGIVDGLNLTETYEPIGAEGRAITAAETKAGELDAALKTELQSEIDGDVKTAIDAEVLRANEAYDIKGAAADAQSAAEATAAGALATARTEITAEIDADVQALANGQVKTNTEAISDLADKVFTKDEVAALLEAQASWGEF